jgi:hypothetical protein
VPSKEADELRSGRHRQNPDFVGFIQRRGTRAISEDEAKAKEYIEEKALRKSKR